ncbi:unnamed protein product [Rotaria sp. Silwood1]|nr:unnamed protein product [Rotaria sp. Silwood1]CAF1076078.1 unnamed protein product [Rotaria sp. Silwood1]CAF3413183.1 unnamed protein product [Rotaria sp. Silwood1]CAF3441098.1 unnamed protein product [Rotaria sp. Silwood1]CAF4501745.1 unnamed protein product [Rotaria sp. Silwood1]
MGAGKSKKKKPTTPIPQYPASANRSVGTVNTGVGGASPMNQQQQLMLANQTIANLNNQLMALQGGAPMPYGGYPYGVAGTPPMPYGGYGYPGGPRMPYGTPPYGGPPSPVLFPPGRQYPPVAGGAGYRDNDFAAIGNIAGLNSAQVALLHREYMNLTRGGTIKMDRNVVRHLLRDVLLEANNEHIDRAIENIFRTIDRNQDGFIDFPEFVGAFKEVLKGDRFNPEQLVMNNAIPDILTAQLRASIFGPDAASQPLAVVQQPQAATQCVPTGGLNIVPLASTGVRKTPMVCTPLSTCTISKATAPLITLDPNQSTCVIATPGQYMITQPTALQCVPLPLM